MRTVLFAHGLSGSPDGTKVTTLRAAGLPLVVPDGRGRPLYARIDALRIELEAHPGSVLVGSSYGGLAAMALASEYAVAQPGLLSALVLLAPALSLRERPVMEPDALVVPPSLPMVVIHGRRDDVIPVTVSRALVRRCPHAVYHEVDDDHELHGSLQLLLNVLRELVVA
ncbi:MAG: alpha/beta fold hydrolase [Myxococcota bacterium]